MKFSPEVLAAHAQFGGDLADMQRRYDAPQRPMTLTRLREAISNLMDATRAECRDGPHAPVEEAQEAVEAAMEAALGELVGRPLAGDVTVKALKAHLRDHWLVSVVCDHEAKTDTATCSCSQWRDEPHPSVGEAVDAWIEHVFGALASPPMPGRGEEFVLVPVETLTEARKGVKLLESLCGCRGDDDYVWDLLAKLDAVIPAALL